MRIFCRNGMIGFSSNESIPIMTSLWIFLAVAPVALCLLVAFAARIDPISGRWRRSEFAGGAANSVHANIIACNESPSTGS